MYCTNCGTEHNEAYCAVCGQAADGSPANQSTNSNGTADPVTGLALSGWWRRVGSSVIDSLVLFPVSLIAALTNHHSYNTPLGTFQAYSWSSGASVVSNLIRIVGVAIYLYFIWTLRNGQSLGNQATGTRVVMVDGSPITSQAALKRVGFITALALAGFLGAALVTIAFVVDLLDKLWPLWDPRKQTLHDKVAETIVISAK